MSWASLEFHTLCKFSHFANPWRKEYILRALQLIVFYGFWGNETHGPVLNSCIYCLPRCISQHCPDEEYEGWLTGITGAADPTRRYFCFHVVTQRRGCTPALAFWKGTRELQHYLHPNSLSVADVPLQPRSDAPLSKSLAYARPA